MKLIDKKCFGFIFVMFLVFSKVQLHSNELNYKNNFSKQISNKDSVNINF